MSKLKTFPKTISAAIQGEGDEAYLAADADPTGASFAEQGQKIKIGIYKLAEVREVELALVSNLSK